jgi:hypothetical protein
MKNDNFTIGDTVLLNGKQGILEAFHKGEAIIYVIEDQERYLATVKKLRHCNDKYDEMVKSTQD